MQPRSTTALRPVGEIGDAENFSKSYFSRILASDCWRGILSMRSWPGRPISAVLRLERPPPASWVEQRARILESKASLAV